MRPCRSQGHLATPPPCPPVGPLNNPHLNHAYTLQNYSGRGHRSQWLT